MDKKKIYRSVVSLLVAGVCMTSFTGCMEQTEPTNIATEGQIQNSPSSAESFLMAMPSFLNTVYSNGWHFPFGYGACIYIRDLMTGDLLQSSQNYTIHFKYWAQDKYQGDGYVFSQFVNTYYYQQVLACNNMIGAVNPDNATDQQLGYLGAGLAFRAMCYLDMARMYEFLPNDKVSSINAEGNDVKGLTVPIVTAEMNQADALNNPRATHEEMFNFIESDLDKAEQYIVNLTDTRSKVLPDLACVYGLKARLYMWNENYEKAAEYARKAINTAKVTPMTEYDCTNYKTGFNDISKWMWGSQQTSENSTVKTGIVNWTSWLSNQTTYGYVGYGEANNDYNEIDKRMYERISDTDFRKLEFKAPEGSELADKVIQIPEATKKESDGTCLVDRMPAYSSVKFRPNEGNISDPNIGAASAYPLMRVEEMYFIEAEATAHTNPAKGKELVESFMKTYRDPNYTCNATSTDDVVEEIVFQKRVELWGEGQTFFDIKRLNYSVTRGYPGTNWYDLTRLNTNGRPAWMNLVLLSSEGNNNQAVRGMNNPDPSDVYKIWKEQ